MPPLLRPKTVSGELSTSGTVCPFIHPLVEATRLFGRYTGTHNTACAYLDRCRRCREALAQEPLAAEASRFHVSSVEARVPEVLSDLPGIIYRTNNEVKGEIKNRQTGIVLLVVVVVEGEYGCLLRHQPFDVGKGTTHGTPAPARGLPGERWAHTHSRRPLKTRPRSPWWQ